MADMYLLDPETQNFRKLSEILDEEIILSAENMIADNEHGVWRIDAAQLSAEGR